MNCPKCGTGIDSGQQYCRSCGAEVAAERRPPFNVQAWGLLALMLIFAGLVTAMGGKIWAVKWVVFMGLVIMFGGVFGIAAYSLLRQGRPRRAKPSSKAVQIPEMLGADTTSKLPPISANDFVPSVVDNTTELLKTPVARGSVSED